MAPVRTIHVVPSLDPDTGGPARSVPALCDALGRQGLTVSLLTLGRTPSLQGTTPLDGFSLRQHRPVTGTRQLPTPAFCAALWRSIRQADLVHLHSVWNPVISLAALMCRAHHVPYLISPRGMLQIGARHRRPHRKRLYHAIIEHHTLCGASGLHFFTDAEAQDSAELTAGVPTFVVPSGVDPAIAATASAERFRRAFPAAQGKRLVVFLGRLHWSKGLDLHVGALEQLAHEFEDLLWVFAGPDGGQWPSLREEIARRDLADRVLWTDLLSRERSLDALAAAHVFVLSSKHEAHSAAMNEALAIGVPVVLTESVQFPAIEEFGAGLIVPGTSRDLAVAITSILASPDRARGMRRGAGRLVAERLAWPRVAEAMAAVYETVLAS